MEFQTYNVDKDINVICFKADTFPEGIQGAYDRLFSQPGMSGRKIYGLSRMEDDKIIYYAGAEELPADECKNTGDAVIKIPKGTYTGTIINDFMDNIPEIGKAFEEILALNQYSDDGYCVEWYFNEKDVQCMVRNKDQ